MASKINDAIGYVLPIALYYLRLILSFTNIYTPLFLIKAMRYLIMYIKKIHITFILFDLGLYIWTHVSHSAVVLCI